MSAQREFLDRLGGSLGFREPKDWYRLTVEDLRKHGGAGLLSKYDGSPSLLVRSVYPDHEWNLCQFVVVPKVHWNRAFMERLGKKLGFKEMKDWYRLTAEDLRQNGGGWLLSRHGGSPSLLVRSVYNDHDWCVWRFRGLRVELDLRGKLEVVERLGEELMVRRLEDWYRISWKQIGEVVPVVLLRRYPLEELLPLAFPNHVWDLARLQSRRGGINKPSQRLLVRTLEGIFPDTGGFHSMP